MYILASLPAMVAQSSQWEKARNKGSQVCTYKVVITYTLYVLYVADRQCSDCLSMYLVFTTTMYDVCLTMCTFNVYLCILCLRKIPM